MWIGALGILSSLGLGTVNYLQDQKKIDKQNTLDEEGTALANQKITDQVDATIGNQKVRTTSGNVFAGLGTAKKVTDGYQARADRAIAYNNDMVRAREDQREEASNAEALSIVFSPLKQYFGKFDGAGKLVNKAFDDSFQDNSSRNTNDIGLRGDNPLDNNQLYNTIRKKKKDIV